MNPDTQTPLSTIAPRWTRARSARPNQFAHPWSYGLALVACLIAAMTSNPTLTCAAIGVLWLIPALLWRRGEPPVLVLALCMQWAQVATRIFQADAAGVNVFQLSTSAHMESAIWLGLIGIALLALGMRIGINRLAIYNHAVVDFQ